MDIHFLSECKACLNIIPMRHVNCRFCGAFQLHVDWEYMDKKVMSFEMLACHRLASEERIERMYNEGADEVKIKDHRQDLDNRRSALAQMVMDKIEENEQYILN